MSRPVPLAIISFLLGVLAVAMLVAPRHFTADYFFFRNPEYAQQIQVSAELVANADIDLSVCFGGGTVQAAAAVASGNSVAAEGSAGKEYAAAAADSANASERIAPVSPLDALESSAATAAEPVVATALREGNSLVIRLQNTGNAAAWGVLECRIGSAGWRVSVPVEDLRPNMQEPAIVVLPIGGIILPEEGLVVKVRWSRLYVK